MVGPFRSFLSHAVKFYKVKQFLFETELVNFHYCLSCLLHVLTSRNNSLLIFFFLVEFCLRKSEMRVIYDQKCPNMLKLNRVAY